MQHIKLWLVLYAIGAGLILLLMGILILLGLGEILRTLDECMNGSWYFSVFVAKKWLASLEIKIVE
jgi:hypothetical protein